MVLSHELLIFESEETSTDYFVRPYVCMYECAFVRHYSERLLLGAFVLLGQPAADIRRLPANRWLADRVLDPL